MRVCGRGCSVARSCPTLYRSLLTPPGSSVRGILQARTLEWAAVPCLRAPSWPRDRTGCPALQADSLLLSHWESSVPGVCRHPATRVGGGAGASCTGHSCFRGHFKNHGLANFPGLSSAFPMLKPRMELRGCGGCYIRASCLMEAVRGRSLWIGEQ